MDEEKVDELTLGGLTGTRRRNLSSDGQLNRQKSAEAIVPFQWKGKG